MPVVGGNWPGERPSFAEVVHEVAVITVDAGVDDGDVCAFAGVTVRVCDFRIRAVYAPRQRLSERFDFGVLLDVADTRNALERIEARCRHRDGEGVPGELPVNRVGEVECGLFCGLRIVTDVDPHRVAREVARGDTREPGCGGGRTEEFECVTTSDSL
ncbi:hypothetical protein ACFQH3_09360 [Haladaptatus sp. GCM10025707]|uniref:hypothetical protein n=1 Tax=unclassified Haladaptatus TaxID=2622732 RepID=UPI0023E75974|nr:hypothetical protein [Haladaptatus sp. QDMS2]